LSLPPRTYELGWRFELRQRRKGASDEGKEGGVEIEDATRFKLEKADGREEEVIRSEALK